MAKITKYTPNKIVNCGSFCEVYLYDAFGNYITKTKIDTDDLEKVKKYKWHLTTKEYVKSERDFLHRLILNTPKGLVTDHINGDKLDNRKQNLRYCTNQQNLFNSKVKGYYWEKDKKKWYAKIMFNRKSIHLGYFINRRQAINARRMAEQKYFGNFAFQY